jgi:hypothetical protein
MEKLPIDVPAFYSEESFIEFCKGLGISEKDAKKILQENDLSVVNYALEKHLTK